MEHEAEKRKTIQTKVTKWLDKNPADMQLLMWDFQEELVDNLEFEYKPTQFRCWLWDNFIKNKEK